jgi:protein-tyrosine phosphatase
MFKLFNRTKEDPSLIADFRSLGSDMHSHLLPGIDDGSNSIENSLELVRGMKELGYSRLITTPHILWDIYKNTHAVIREKAEQLNVAIAEKGLGIEVHAAAEYFLDEHLDSLLRENEPLLTISGKMVLVEFSLAFPSHSIKDILFQLQMQGYLPVVAHPERYIYLEKEKTFYDELKDIGCLFQLNILSLTNYYGKSVHELAQFLIKKNYYDLVGTDLHHARHLEALRSSSLAAPLKKLLDSGMIKNSSL